MGAWTFILTFEKKCEGNGGGGWELERGARTFFRFDEGRWARYLFWDEKVPKTWPGYLINFAPSIIAK